MSNRTDRPTATYPTADHLAHLEREEAAHRERLADLWADRTPTEELPLAPAAAPLPSGQPGPSRVSTRPEPTDGRETPLQDMWRPRWLPAWHPSLMQLAIGAALVAALLASAQLLALDGIASARQAAIERGRGATAAPSQPAPTPTAKAAWTVHGTGAPYSRDDPTASPLDLPRCTTSPDTPMPCLARKSADSRHAVVLEEDASLTGLDRG